MWPSIEVRAHSLVVSGNMGVVGRRLHVVSLFHSTVQVSFARHDRSPSAFRPWKYFRSFELFVLLGSSMLSMKATSDSDPVLCASDVVTAMWPFSCLFFTFNSLNQLGAFPSAPPPCSQHLSIVCPVLRQFGLVHFAFFLSGHPVFLNLAASAASCVFLFSFAWASWASASNHLMTS